MTLLDDIRDLMPFTVGLELVTGRDPYNQRVFADAISYPALVVPTRRRVLNAQGEEQQLSATVYLGTNSDVPVDSRVILPDGSTRDIVLVERHPDENGYQVTVVHV